MQRSQRIQALIRLFIVGGICILINVLASQFHGFIDLTEEKRYTLTPATLDLIQEVDERIYIKVLLDGKLPAEVKALRTAVAELMDDFNDENSNIDFEFSDPNDGNVEFINQQRKALAEEGIVPIQLTITENSEMTKKYVYPFAIVYYGARKIPINLLETIKMNADPDQAINESIQLLEYKFTSAISKLLTEDRKNIFLVEGHDELKEIQTRRLALELKSTYNTGRIDLDTVVSLPSAVDVLIIAKPKTRFSEKELFVIDQYVMNGGNVIWMLDQLEVSLDSINRNKFYIPEPLDLNLDNILFKYGVRINKDLVLDLECTRIPQVVGGTRENPQTILTPWYYHPLVSSTNAHPIVKNINHTHFSFPSTIDTLKPRRDKPIDIRKTVLLQSSNYSRYQLTPVRLNFEILRYEPDPQKFNKGPQNLAVLVEGEFESYFTNRVTQELKDVYSRIGKEIKLEGSSAKQLFISDGDVVKNVYDPNGDFISEMGYNRWEKRAFGGNRDLLVNAIEYMTDDRGILNSRSKEIKLRLLDRVKIRAEKTKWQFINIAAPLIILLLLGLTYHFLRRRRYTKLD